jgi:hypothetical protein
LETTRSLKPCFKAKDWESLWITHPLFPACQILDRGQTAWKEKKLTNFADKGIKDFSFPSQVQLAYILAGQYREKISHFSVMLLV